ncbi:MAG: hypothetical protein ACTSPI_01200 [Candidatus Heimdallarchaeaceae archaeon]
MDKKELKKIMTNLAAGHISKKEADNLIKPKKTHPDKPVGEKKHKSKHARKRSIKVGGKIK